MWELRFFDVHGFVGAPCRNHLHLEATLASLLVVAKVVNRVVGGADTFYVIVAHETTGREFWLLQFFVTFVEDFAGCLWGELLGDAEGSLQFQVRPVVERVAEAVSDSLRPLLKLLPVRSLLTSAQALDNPNAQHSTPQKQDVSSRKFSSLNCFISVLLFMFY